MKLRTRQILFFCIVLGLVFISCQFSPFDFISGFQKKGLDADQPQATEEDGGFFKTLLPDWLTGNLPKKGEETNTKGLEPRGFTLVGQLGGSSMAVAVAGDLAVLGQGPRVVILDVSNPENPALLGESEVLSGLVMGIEVVGEYAYATTMYGGLNILDISNPSSPNLVSSVAPKVPGCDGISIEGDIAYMACNPNGLFIVDIKNPKNPEILFQETKPVGAVISIAHVGSYVYMANVTTDGLDIFNVENPKMPVQGTLYYSDIPGTETQQGGSFISVRSCGKNLCLGTGDSLIILDLADPAKPTVLSQLGKMMISGMVVDGDTVYADDYEGISVIDISDPGDPTKIGLLPWQVGGWELTVVEIGERGLFIQNDQLYITDPAYGLTIANVGDPANPVLIGSYMTPLPDVLFKVRLKGDNAFVVSRDGGFRTVDISDPSHPRELAYDDERKNGYSQTPSGLEIRDDYAYISDSNYPFHIYDISNPAKPRQTGAVYDESASDGAFDIVLNGDVAYLSGWATGEDAFYPGEGIWVIDIADPDNPSAVTFVDVANKHWDLSIANNYLFALDGLVDKDQPEPISLRVFDLSNPRKPEEVNAIPIPELQNSEYRVMLTDEDRLYIGIAGLGVLVYDISEPSKPERMATIPIMASMEGMIKEKQYLIISGMSAYNISNLQKPDFAGSFLFLQAWDFAVKEDLVFVATTFQGMYVLRFDPIS